jgi:membrane-associated phospholipid phosphatase
VFDFAGSTTVGDAVGNSFRIRTVIGRWLMFSDHGAAAQCHMTIVWACVFGCAFADGVLLQVSRLTFAAANWTLAFGTIFCCAIAAALISSFGRLHDDPCRLAHILRQALSVTDLLTRAIFPLGALLTAGVTLSYVITATNMPLRDAWLAQLDRNLGFQWLQFLDATNSNPYLAALLRGAYQTIGPVSQLVIVWLAVVRHGERLAELLAILSVSTVALCAAMWLVPAAGAFAYYHPGQVDVANYGALSDMWSFSHAFFMLRNGSLSVIDLSSLRGVVSFPSFHTMLGLMTVYALRDMRWLMVPVVLVNGVMLVSTLPVGGHYLADVLAGAALTVIAIVLVSWAKNRALADRKTGAG